MMRRYIALDLRKLSTFRFEYVLDQRLCDNFVGAEAVPFLVGAILDLCNHFGSQCIESDSEVRGQLELSSQQLNVLDTTHFHIIEF
ncbi:CIC11C00000001574 [Sungouiella intermedia]|uniref:CIC11C00000001574 n=1 Tax=Sungouiella intermedia TaxID=45354 RepID=A0A1L0BU25_9ASCO|nr:CIC11C00000001574 [[Candida] intermedia]